MKCHELKEVIKRLAAEESNDHSMRRTKTLITCFQISKYFLFLFVILILMATPLRTMNGQTNKTAKPHEDEEEEGEGEGESKKKSGAYIRAWHM